MIIFTFLGKKYAILCFPSPRGRGYLCLSFCRVGVMMFLPHLIEGEYMCVLRSVEMGAFSEVIATSMKETTHTGKSHTHTHTHHLSCDRCGHSILQGHGDWQGLWEGLDLERMPSISSVQSLRCVWLFATPWTAARQASLSITISWSLVRLMSIELVMPSNHLIFCYPLHLLLSVFPSIRVFSDESALCIRWPEYWSFNFSISPSIEYSGLISFSMDWFDLLAAQGTLKSQG